MQKNRNSLCPLLRLASQSNGEQIDCETVSDLDHCQSLIAGAAAAFPEWSSTTALYRASKLIALSQVIKSWSERFCDLMIQEIGTTRTWAEHNVDFAVEMLEAVASYADELETGRRQMIVGNPEAADTQIGPVISVGAADRLSGLISDAVSKGAMLIGGGGIRDAFVEPTLLDRVEPDMRVYNEEVFGPLLSITRVANEQEAITIANDSEYGLAAAIFSRNVPRALALAGKLHSGICHINRATVDDNPHAPFGGVKSSGYGRFGGRWALHEFTELRWITLSESDNNRAR